MNIIISGYGRMGKEVEKICNLRNHNIIARLDDERDWQDIPQLDSVVIIDFSLPDVVTKNIDRAFELNIPIVTGTTGWHDEIGQISNLCKLKNGTLFYASNFSIGVNVFLKANAFLAKLMSDVGGYSVKINETHHIHKLDAPSGTAITAAEGIINNNPSINGWLLNESEDGYLPIFSTREGEVTGKHNVSYESEADYITLSHEAKNRSGFALGAVLAAEFVINKKGVFVMDDLLNNIG